MALPEDRLRSILESLLLISPEPVPAARLVEVIQIEDPQTDEAAVRAAIMAMVESYRDPSRTHARGFRVDEVAAGLQLRTVPENAPYVRRYLAAKPQRLSKPVLETLAIIAYRQPIGRIEIEYIRGVGSAGVIRTLQDRGVVEVVGRGEGIGRPLLYGTTTRFLEHFGFNSLDDLPRPEELPVVLRDNPPIGEDEPEDDVPMDQPKAVDPAQADLELDEEGERAAGAEEAEEVRHG